jgi:poly(3-hydroxybutyrate) depolymerase
MAAPVIPIIIGGAAALTIGLYVGHASTPSSASPKYAFVGQNTDLGGSHEGALLRRRLSQNVHDLKHRASSGNSVPASPDTDPTDRTIREVMYWFN